MMLDQDQRKLLKMRNTKLINSDEDENLTHSKVKKCLDKKKLL